MNTNVAPKEFSWDEIRTRLRNYSEEANDSWEKISGAFSDTQAKNSANNKKSMNYEMPDNFTALT
jgi:hypothetical protein